MPGRGVPSMTIVDHVPFWSGLALLLMGWALYWIAVTSAGALLFGLTGLAVATLAVNLAGSEGNIRLGIQIGSLLAGGFIGAFLFRFLSRFAFFCVGALIGAAGTCAVIAHMNQTDDGTTIKVLPTLIGGAVGGVLFAVLDDIILAAASSVIGGILLMMGLGWPMDGLPILAIVPAGFLFQVGLSRGKKNRDKRDSRDEDD